MIAGKDIVYCLSKIIIASKLWCSFLPSFILIQAAKNFLGRVESLDLTILPTYCIDIQDVKEHSSHFFIFDMLLSDLGPADLQYFNDFRIEVRTPASDHLYSY